MSTEPPPPVNPYAASDELAHGEAIAGEPAPPVQRRPHRAVAIIIAILAQPLAGAGLYVLGRRSAAAWTIAGLCAYAAMVASVIVKVPVMFVAAVPLIAIIVLASIVYTVFAKPGPAPQRGSTGVLVALFLILAARGGNFAAKKWLAEGYQIPAGGMMPTLLIGDQMMIAKTKRIGPGDVVVFRYPRDPDVKYVKRAIAFGGQTIEIKDGVVWIDGAAMQQWPLVGGCPSSDHDAATDTAGCRLLQENAGRGWYSIMRHSFGSADAPPYVVPAGHVFVLGDNRDNSSDSRVWGPVSLDLVEGRAAFVWSSRDTSGLVRWNRVGRKID